MPRFEATLERRGTGGGRALIGLNKEVRAGAGVEAGDRVTLDLARDEGNELSRFQRRSRRR